MQDSLKQQVLDAIQLVMRPIARIMLRYGIGYREFVEVAKSAFVSVASADFGLRGRPTNISRVAVMTGLTRKEVRRIREKLDSGDSSIAVKSTPLADVLHHWHAQPDYTETDGRPRVLPFSGPSGSFSSLVKAHGGDVPAGAMRTEMKRVGVVEELDDGQLRVLGRTFFPDSDHEALMTSLIHGAYALLSTIAHNSNPEHEDKKWANRYVYTRSLNPTDAGQLRRIAKDRISEFTESVDDIFIAYEALHEGQGDKSNKEPIAVGVFYFEETDLDADYEW